MKIRKNAFTLIELLVVIAIIGILSSVVLLVFTGTKNSAKDARMKEEMVQIRNAATMVFYAEKNYDNVKCVGGNSEVVTMCNAINEHMSPNALTIVRAPEPNSTKYCVYIALFGPKSGTTNYYCLDSTGTTKETTTDPGGVLGECKVGGTIVCP
ncbi:MAG: type II secretion system protein [bacterium]